MTEEIWRPIIGFEGLYEISSLGNVKAVEKTIKKRDYTCILKEKILKKHISNCGYLRVTLYRGGKSKKISVHRLVCLLFVSNPDNKPCVNHKDLDKTNNYYDNLEWCTHSENSKHLHASGYKMPFLKPVIQYDLNGNFIREYESGRITREYGFQHTAVCMCCKGKIKTHAGFKWEYK